MGKVTYAIGFRNELPFRNEIKQQRRLYSRYREKGDTGLAADTARQLADTLLDQADELIAMEEADDMYRKSLHSAIAYCKEASSQFARLDRQKDRFSADLLKIKCLQRLKEYDTALSDCQQLESLVRDVLSDDYSIQQELYKNSADLYFNKGADEERSKRDDFQHAKRYYELERDMLRQLEGAGDYGDTDELKDLIRANTFNLGVIENKVRGDLALAGRLLRQAIDQARSLHDLNSERSAWWELGNIYKTQRDFKNALDCQSNELKLAQLDDLQETELLCLYDIATTRLETDNYDQCQEIEHDIMALANDQSYAVSISLSVTMPLKYMFLTSVKPIILTSHVLRLKESLVQQLERIRSSAIKVEEAERINAQDPIEKAKIYMELAKAYHGVLMNDKALQTLEKCISCLSLAHPVDAISVTLNIDGLVLRGDVNWQIKKGDAAELALSYLEALALAESAGSMLTSDYTFSVKEACMEKLLRIYDYFYAAEERDQWAAELDHIKSTGDRIMENAEDHFSSSDEDIQPDQSMENDQTGTLQSPILVMDSASNIRDYPMVIEVDVVDPKQERKLLIPWNDHSKTVQWLNDEIVNRCWMAFGQWPRLSHLETRGARMFADDMLAHVFSENRSVVSATVEAYEQKSLEDVYLNACYRLKCTPDDDIKAKLHSSVGNSISLNGMGLALEDIRPLFDTISYSKTLKILDLSANSLDDSALSNLFTTHTGQTRPILPNLHTLTLASNCLSAASFALLVDALSPTLETLNLSHNPLGSDAIVILPNAARQFPKLKRLWLENCELGKKNTYISSLLDATDGEEGRSGLSISVANNAIEYHTRHTLHAALARIPGLQSLNYSRITPVLPPSCLDSLSWLKSLCQLDLGNSMLGDSGVESLCFLLKTSKSLKSLDISYCGITALHMKPLSQALQENETIDELVMVGNKVEIEGVQTLIACTRRSSPLILDTIELTDCCISADVYEIARLTQHFRCMDISQNMRIDSNADLEYLLGVMLEESRCEQVTVDASIKDVDIDRISQTRPDICSRISVHRHPIRSLMVTALKHII